MINKEEAKIILDWLRIVNWEHGEEQMSSEEVELEKKLKEIAKD